jgi:hypothetical protein
MGSMNVYLNAHVSPLSYIARPPAKKQPV